MDNHYLSGAIVDFAVRHRAGAIRMKLLDGSSRQDGHAVPLRSWAYCDLQRDIDHKAGRVGRMSDGGQ